MHFMGWKLGLKTGMYYLRTKPAAAAIQFTVDKEKQRVRFFYYSYGLSSYYFGQVTYFELISSTFIPESTIDKVDINKVHFKVLQNLNYLLRPLQKIIVFPLKKKMLQLLKWSQIPLKLMVRQRRTSENLTRLLWYVRWRIKMHVSCVLGV